MTKTLWPLAALALGAVLAFNMPDRSLAMDNHDHMKGHSHGDGDGHKHKEDEHKKHDMHGKHGGKHHDGHDEHKKDHAKHHPSPSHGGVIMELHDHHGELVAKDGRIVLHLTDHDGHTAPAKGFSATAMVLAAQGRQGPISLKPTEKNRLESSKAVNVPSGARIIITMKDPHGHMTQARYQMP